MESITISTSWGGYEKLNGMKVLVYGRPSVSDGFATKSVIHGNIRETKTASLPKELQSNWLRQEGHKSALRMILSRLRKRSMKICHSESMTILGWEGQKMLHGIGRTCTCLWRRGRDLMNKVGKGICVRQDSMSKGMKTQKGDERRKSWISSARIMIVCWHDNSWKVSEQSV